MVQENSVLKRALQIKPIARFIQQDASQEPGDLTVKAKVPKTGPGTLVAHLAETDVVRIENKHLKEELKLWSEATPAKRINAENVKPSKWANRIEESFHDESFTNLKSDIGSAGGNVQAIKVRPIVGGEVDTYEIVFGHRRHRACLELGLPVLALIESISEQTLFQEMDRENRQRADLRPYEQGLMYARALDEGLFPSMRKMAEALGVDVGLISRYVSFKKLPVEVLNAFASPLDLQYDWASKLTDAISKNPELVMNRAKVLCHTTPRLSSALTFKHLIEIEGVVSHNTLNKKPFVIKGKDGQKGEINCDPKAKTISINIKNISAERLTDVKVAIESLLS